MPSDIERLELTSTNVISAKDTILPALNMEKFTQLDIPGSDVIEVKCCQCGRTIWTEYTTEDTKIYCATCANTLPR